MEVENDFKLSCQLEICKERCLEPCALGPYSAMQSHHRVKRRANTEVIEVEGGAIVIAKDDQSKLKRTN